MDAGARVLVDGTWLGTVRNVTDGMAYVSLDQGSAGTFPVERVTVVEPADSGSSGKSWPPDSLETKGAAG